MPKRNTSNLKSLKKVAASSKKTGTKKTAVLSGCAPDPVSYDDVSKVHPALRPYLGYCLHKVSTILKSQVNAVYSEQQLQGQHFAILSVISVSPEINQMKICEEMGIDKASMVKITDHLEKHRLIERVGSKEDRRVKNLHITPLGEKFLKTAQSRRLEIEKNFLTALSDSEVVQFKELLLKILDQHKKN